MLLYFSITAILKGSKVHNQCNYGLNFTSLSVNKNSYWDFSLSEFAENLDYKIFINFGITYCVLKKNLKSNKPKIE